MYSSSPALGGTSPIALAEARSRRLFAGTLIATAVIKLIAASLVPITGDEAYFFLWGRHLDYGYYDHGPMVAWWLAPLLRVSDALGWLRLPAVMAPLLVAWWLRQTVQPFGIVKANLTACLFLVSPINLINIFVTTDTPLLVFTALAGLTALAADRRASLPLWGLAGFCLGLAFLAKYLAVLLGVAWAVWLLFFHTRRRWGALAMILIGAAPAVAVNIAWNHHHGWTNVLFNVVTRNGDAGVNLFSPLMYVGLWMVLLGPALVPLVAAGLRRHGLRDGWGRLKAAVGYGPLLMATVPAVLLGLVSLFQEVGVHWLVAYLPWAALCIAAAAPTERIARTLKHAWSYGGLQIIILAIACAAPTDWLGGQRQYTSVVIGVHSDEVVGALAPYRADYMLASDSYARGALLAYHIRDHVPIVGFGSHHGRQDDLLTDFRTFEGQNLMFFSNRPGRLELARSWFESFEVKEFEVRGAAFQLFLGRGFSYAAYRSSVLETIASRYYTTPRWLTALSPPADFLRRYGFAGQKE